MPAARENLLHAWRSDESAQPSPSLFVGSRMSMCQRWPKAPESGLHPPPPTPVLQCCTFEFLHPMREYTVIDNFDYHVSLANNSLTSTRVFSSISPKIFNASASFRLASASAASAARSASAPSARYPVVFPRSGPANARDQAPRTECARNSRVTYQPKCHQNSFRAHPQA